MSFAQPFQDYEILDRVGAGAMGTVFKARHRKLSRIVALKVLKPSLARDARFVDRLRREARIVAALSHPNIVTGYDLGEEAGYHYFVMEFVEGKSLRALLAEWGIFAEEQVRKVARQVAEALDHAFQRGVIHRDIKPGNILIDDAGTVKLTDMGLAKGPADLTLTRDGATVGTPQYISPEQARSPQDADVRSDLYSLGATLYHMATGQPPFRGESMAEVITKVLHEPPVPPRALNPALSEDLSLIVRKLLSKNPGLRYQNPRELLDDLDRLDAAAPVAVDLRRLLAAESGPRPGAWLWSLAVVAGVVLLGAGIWLGTLLGPGPAGRNDAAEFLATLDGELAGMSSFEGRIERLRAAAAVAPAEAAPGVEQRRRQEFRAAQQAVDEVVAGLFGDDWNRTRSWLSDPTRWPSRSDYVRDQLDRALFERVRLLSSRLPPGIDPAPLERLLLEVDRELRQRDLALHGRFLHHLDVVLPARVEARLRVGDFHGAGRLLEGGFVDFFDGLRQPLVERLDEGLAQQCRHRFETMRETVATQIEVVEAGAAAALRQEVMEQGRLLRQSCVDEPDPSLLRPMVARLRQRLLQVHPAPGQFRASADPWPAIEGQLRLLEAEVEAAAAAAMRRLREQMLDLAWRAFLGGDADAALAVLADVAADGTDADRLRLHRRVLGAAGQVNDTVLRCLLRKAPPIPGHPQRGVLPVELSVVVRDGLPQLFARPAGGAPRAARLVEFRFGELLALAREAAPELLRALPAGELDLGIAVLQLCGDNIAPTTDAEVDRFLRNEVWPRIVRIRGESGDTDVERTVAFRRLREAWDRSQRTSDTRELEVALAAWNSRFQRDASPEESRYVRSAAQWLDREQQRQAVEAELRRNLPAGATAAVRGDGDSLRAEVVLTAAALQRGMLDGWQQRGDGIGFGGGAPSWPEAQGRRLDIAGALPATAGHTICSLDLVLPAASAGLRVYVFEFRGVGCVVTMTAGDRVLAAMIDGDVRRTESVQAACRRALAGALDDGQRAALVPGAVHRLRFELVPAAARGRAVAIVAFDQTELCREQVGIDLSRPPELHLLPLQDVVVKRAELVACLR